MSEPPKNFLNIGYDGLTTASSYQTPSLQDILDSIEDTKEREGAENEALDRLCLMLWLRVCDLDSFRKCSYKEFYTRGRPALAEMFKKQELVVNVRY